MDRLTLDDEKDKQQTPKLYDKLGQFVAVTMRLFNQGRYLTPEAKWVYATLRSFTNNDTGRTFPSYTKIEKRSGLNRPAISKALKELKHFKWIEKKKKYNNATEYYLAYPTIYADDGTKFEDQTCPTKEEAVEWNELNRIQRKSKKLSDWDMKKLNRQHHENLDANYGEDEFEDESIPF